MIDSHAHLIWESFDYDRSEVIERALSNKVEAFIHSCVHTKDLEKMFDLQEQYSMVHLSAGVHPCDAHHWSDECESDILKYKDKIIAIGETGLDYFHKDCPLDVQETVFRKHCKLAKELKLPLIIHCRDAFEDTLKILREEDPGGGVMHCYTGDAEYSAKFWELGFYTSFSGCLTFKNSKKLREEARNIPLSRTLIETDCPFLAPQKHRGKRNEPVFVTEVNSMLAEIHSIEDKEVDSITTENTKKLFSLNQ
ncbi:MAG: TatD family hydrolase [Candidatus Caenarcaniphilales bacterium]|nr:TatD family hydrolase [Candidatus Caenarcaniphilales bacterium]